MKKVIKNLMYSALVLCAATCFVACDKNDDPTPPSPDKVTGEVTYTVGEMLDLKDLMDVTVEYMDETGKKTTEVVTGPWKKNVKISLPCTIYMKISYKRKPNIAYTKDTYTLGVGSSVNADFSGKKSYISGTLNHTKDYRKEHIETNLIRLENTPKVYMQEME